MEKTNKPFSVEEIKKVLWEYSKKHPQPDDFLTWNPESKKIIEEELKKQFQFNPEIYKP